MTQLISLCAEGRRIIEEQGDLWGVRHAIASSRKTASNQLPYRVGTPVVWLPCIGCGVWSNHIVSGGAGDDDDLTIPDYTTIRCSKCAAGAADVERDEVRPPMVDPAKEKTWKGLVRCKACQQLRRVPFPFPGTEGAWMCEWRGWLPASRRSCRSSGKGEAVVFEAPKKASVVKRVGKKPEEAAREQATSSEEDDDDDDAGDEDEEESDDDEEEEEESDDEEEESEEVETGSSASEAPSASAASPEASKVSAKKVPSATAKSKKTQRDASEASDEQPAKKKQRAEPAKKASAVAPKVSSKNAEEDTRKRTPDAEPQSHDKKSARSKAKAKATTSPKRDGSSEMPEDKQPWALCDKCNTWRQTKELVGDDVDTWECSMAGYSCVRHVRIDMKLWRQAEKIAKQW